jgi:putative intracellular protease/amidase
VRAAFERGLVVGVSGFGIWLLAVARNAGATIVDGRPAVFAEGNLVTSVGAGATDAFVDRIIERISAQDRP